MADTVEITAGSGTVISTEEVTTLNGGAVTAQQVQRVAVALRTGDGTAVDVPGSSTDGVLVNLGANNDITGTVTANAGTNLNTSALALESGGNLAGIRTAVETIDNAIAGSEMQVDVITVPAPLSTTGAGTEAAALRVTIATDSTGVLSIDDNGGTLTVDDGGSSLTVDGSVTVSGTVTANLAAGTNNIGDVDVLSVPAPLSTTGGGTEATALRVTIATDSTGVLSVDDNGGSITVDGTITANLAAGTNNIGDVDVLSLPTLPSGSNTIGDVTISGAALTALQLIDNAIGVDDAGATIGVQNVSMAGGYVVAHGANPDVADAGDAGMLLLNRHRIPFMLGGHPNISSAEYFTSAAQTNDNILPAISTGTIYVITGITVTCSNANTVNTSCRIGFGSTTVPTQGASGDDAVLKVILSHPGIAPGSGVPKGNGGGIVGIGGDGEELRITCSAPTSGSLVVQVDYFTISS